MDISKSNMKYISKQNIWLLVPLNIHNYYSNSSSFLFIQLQNACKCTVYIVKLVWCLSKYYNSLCVNTDSKTLHYTITICCHSNSTFIVGVHTWLSTEAVRCVAHTFKALTMQSAVYETPFSCKFTMQKCIYLKTIFHLCLPCPLPQRRSPRPC